MAFGARPTLILASLALLPAQSDSFEGTRPGDERQIAGIRFSWAPAGTFRMGSPLTEPERRADEGPVTVTLSQGFWIGKFEVTQAQWLARMSAFPRNQDKGRGGDVPVYWVSYLDATEFCRRLTTHARASGDLPAGWEI